MHEINSRSFLEDMRKKYEKGARVELIKMDDPYCPALLPGVKGTVLFVDDIGTIHVKWDCGSTLGVIYGEDTCKLL